MSLGEEGDVAGARTAVVVVVDDDVAEVELAPPRRAAGVSEVDAHDGHRDPGGAREQADAAVARRVVGSSLGVGLSHGLDAQRELLLAVTHVLEEGVVRVRVGLEGVRNDLDRELAVSHGLSLGWGWWKTLLKAMSSCF